MPISRFYRHLIKTIQKIVETFCYFTDAGTLFFNISKNILIVGVKFL